VSPLLLPATCLLAVSELELEASDTGWEESGHHEVLATGRCPHVDVVLPPGASLDRIKASVRPADGGRRRIDALRTVALPPSSTEPERIRLLTPDALTGDAIWIDLDRSLPATDYTWRPGEADGRYASLDADVPFPHEGEERRTLWFADAPNDTTIVVPHPSPAQDVPGNRPLPTVPSRATLTQTLRIPGDPQRSLYPGGGSSVDTTWTIVSSAPDTPSALVLPLPADVRDLVVEGPHRRGHRAVTLLVDAATTHTVRWSRLDAPTHGARATLPGAEVDHRVQADDARIRWEDDRYWSLASLGMRRLTPDHRDLIGALDRRFRRAALPEPATPVHLRGMAPDAATAAALRTALQLRAGIGPLALDPLFPRRLVKARKSGALTSVEAALITMLQLGQLGGRATWGLVDPGPPRQASDSTPVGYTEGVVVVSTTDGLRFVDPGCAVCAGYEVRPQLQGTRMLSPAGRAGPPVVEGRAVVDDRDGVRTVRLEGPAALRVRLALSEQAKADRTAWLVTTFAGDDATFEGATGLGTPGAPIELRFGLGAAPPDGRFVAGRDWVGERTWTHDGAAPPAHVHEGALCALTRADGDRRTDVLTVTDARLPPDTWSAFRAKLP
jgi:hypothetical protein